jgi:hypothetical protein
VPGTEQPAGTNPTAQRQSTHAAAFSIRPYGRSCGAIGQPSKPGAFLGMPSKCAIGSAMRHVVALQRPWDSSPATLGTAGRPALGRFSQVEGVHFPLQLLLHRLTPAHNVSQSISSCEPTSTRRVNNVQGFRSRLDPSARLIVWSAMMWRGTYM